MVNYQLSTSLKPGSVLRQVRIPVAFSRRNSENIGLLVGTLAGILEIALLIGSVGVDAPQTFGIGGTPHPVSYTHLDVYKRQVLTNPLASCTTSRMWGYLAIHPIQNFRIGGSSGCMTHLINRRSIANSSALYSEYGFIGLV